ncbi:MAG TPA: MDR family MFS transporter [Solirubrobacteraceae bacterium]
MSTPATTHPRVRAIFGALMLVLLLAALDHTIVATALPTIVAELGGLEHLSWVTSAYLLAQTAVTPLYGKLGDLYGRKRLLQVAIGIFLLGSALCGLAQGMTELIAFRAVQGLGGGGLIVLTLASVGDIVSPRERGRYQGYFGAVFGVSSVGGPLLGGLIVEHVSWRWIFYVNLPLGLLAVAVIAATLPAVAPRSRPAIDYAGATLLAAGLSAIVLVTSLGGTTWAWGSAQVVGVGALGVVLLAAFLRVERGAREPILPLLLLRDRTFAVAGLLSLIVGFALFGAVTFLPLYFQTVDAASPTQSGLRLVPMMAGVLLTSIVSGRLITRTGRYRRYPIAGTAVMTAGLLLLSLLGVGTAALVAAGFLLVLGMGMGLSMQVLVLAVQNAVDYRHLGSATSNVTMLRGIGGSLGAAVFGAIFAGRLGSELAGGGAGEGARLTGDQVARLPAAARAAYEQAFVDAMHPVFLAAAGVAAVGFLVSLLLPERPLRSTAASSQGLEDALAAPKAPDSLAEVERAIARCTRVEDRRRFHARLAERAGAADLDPGAAWALVRIDEHGVEGAQRMAREQEVAPERVAAVIDDLRRRELVHGEDGALGITERGRDVTRRLVSARREILDETLADPDAGRTPEVDALLRRLSRELVGEPDAADEIAARAPS